MSALVPATTLVARWFSARRSVALSITSTGLSLGGILLTPVAASLITRLGLEASVPWLAAAARLLRAAKTAQERKHWISFLEKIN